MSTDEDRRNAALDDERIQLLEYEHEHGAHSERVPDCPYCEDDDDD